MRPQERTTEHLAIEAQAVVAAGMITTAHILNVIMFYVLENPAILARLQCELAGLSAENSGAKPTRQQLERLPCLTANINEGLRMGHGVMHRLRRISPDKVLQFNQWVIPKGVGPTRPLLTRNRGADPAIRFSRRRSACLQSCCTTIPRSFPTRSPSIQTAGSENRVPI